MMKNKPIITLRSLVTLAARRVRRAARAFGRLPRKRRIVVGLIVVAAAAGVTVLVIRPSARDNNAVASTKTLPAPTGPQKGTPAYKTILPESKDIASLGGWTRVSPPDSTPAYAYIDTLGATKIIVSEQQLPKEFADDPEGQTAGLATNYHATKKLVVGSTTVYLGTSTEGPQSVIFQRDGLLVLIKAASAIDDASWKAYVNSLQ